MKTLVCTQPHHMELQDVPTPSCAAGEAMIRVQRVADELLQICIDTASGRYRPRAVELEQLDFIPWKRGVSL